MPRINQELSNLDSKKTNKRTEVKGYVGKAFCLSFTFSFLIPTFVYASEYIEIVLERFPSVTEGSCLFGGPDEPSLRQAVLCITGGSAESLASVHYSP